MAKKINQSEEQKKMYNDLKKLVKRANQRILRLERLTGEKGQFAVKQLYDYLDAEMIQGISAKGRVRLSKLFTTTQLTAIERAVNQFLNSGYSTVSEIKKVQKKYSKESGKELTLKQSNVLYQSGKNYSWIIGMNGLTESEFWGTWVPLAKRRDISKEDWIESLANRIGVEIDNYMDIFQILEERKKSLIILFFLLTLKQLHFLF